MTEFTKEELEQRIKNINDQLNNLYNNYNQLQMQISDISRYIVQLQGQLQLLLEIKQKYYPDEPPATEQTGQ